PGLRLDESGDLDPAQPLGVVRDLDLAPLGVLQAQRMVHELDQVAVGILDVGVVLAAVLAPPLLRIRTADARTGAGRRGPYVRNAELGEVGQSGFPVIDLDREVAGHRDPRARRYGEVDLAAAEPQLELPLVQRRATVEELGAEDLLVPRPRSFAVADLDIHVVDELDGHG